ncbi:SDR family NAD(P)-dependent oxidoreductase [Caulobacter sp. 17J80-11]|uniref:SDR family NAD(P)-dependent oxidoreductase n=1 Tax=Caulobacter sp. 17J80-11 TaxID=2763502 RepID=UPI001653C3DE|nr:SDR family NAD(P)-dependent oxidoreductase [Caulobacter sp. 17J80-11]MBC6981393.1 SDR family NAD(P)-dependent oxidoreductase [Caulobacter sp. 17J80-11]
MKPELAVVAGASGGLGRAFCERIMARGSHARVLALSRERPDGWEDDAKRGWARIDLLDEDTLSAAAEAIARQGEPSLIIIATGRLHRPGLTPEKSYRSIGLEALTELFAVNAAGPALLAKHLLPLTPVKSRSVFAALSARVGSIGDNRLGGWHAYRASKAALNMLLHTIAIEHRRLRPQGVCVALHPGTTDTELSKPFQAGVPPGKLFAPAQAADALLAVIDRLGPEDSGGFFAWDGSTIPW